MAHRHSPSWVPLVCFFLSLAVAPASAQPSILNSILNAEDALVEVQSENITLYRSPKGRMVMNPQTGQMAVLQGVRKASYLRQGSGIIIHPSGLIVTNAHIIDKASRVRVTMHNGQEVPAAVLKVINNMDLAFLKIPPPFPLKAVAIADSQQIRLGDEVITVGHSFLLRHTVSGGRVIGLGRSHASGRTRGRTDLIQTSFNLYEGDSGGPVFNDQGELIGMMVARETWADHSSFAIPSNHIARFLTEYLKELPPKKQPGETE